MKVSEDKVKMAYALGGVTCAKKEEENKRVDLETVNEDWKDYVITGHGYERSNNTYSLYYRGDFGSEQRFVRLMSFAEGWNLNHAVAMLISAIDMHKAEVKTKTE